MLSFIINGMVFTGSFWLLRNLFLFILQNLGSIALGDFMKNFKFSYKYFFIGALIGFLSYLSYEVNEVRKFMYGSLKVYINDQVYGGEDYIETPFKSYFNIKNCETIFKQDEEVQKECELLEQKFSKKLDS